MTQIQDPRSLHPEELKACCAAGYSSDAVALLLGESYHPGGLHLTRHLLKRLGLTPGQRLVDIASGRGQSALLAAGEYDVSVAGVDLSATNIAAATAAAEGAGLEDRVHFQVGDAEAVPLPDAVADAVICECALCTFPAKERALTEMARLLRPGGLVGITDIAADRSRLPDALTGLTAWIACIADARPLAELQALAERAGLRVEHTERHTAALTRMIDQIEARLAVLRMVAPDRLVALGVDADRSGPVLEAARAAVDAGTLDYVLLIASKP